MQTRLFIAVLLLAPLAAATAGLDRFGTRQSVGIFVTREGRTYSIYVDFDAREHGDDGKESIPFTLTTDLDLWVEGHPLEAGRYEWTLDMEPGRMWTVGEPEGREQPGDLPSRMFLLTRPTAGDSPWLTATLAPDERARDVELRFRYGTKEGLLILSLEDGAVEKDATAPALDLVELRGLRDRLRGVAGVLESGAARRHLWSTFLSELGDAILQTAGTGWVQSIEVTDEGDRVMLEVVGRAEGDLAVLEKIHRRVAGGVLGRVFAHVEPVIPRTVPKETAREFTIRAETSLAELRRSEPIAALTPGEDPIRTAEEVLLIEERLRKVAGSKGSGVGAYRDVILGAKRVSGALVSKISADEAVTGREGIWTQTVHLSASGPGATLVRLIRELEDAEIPARVRVRSFGPGDFGPEIELTVQFLGYRGLSERNPRLLGAVRELGETSRFTERLGIYLRGVKPGTGRPFVAPDWGRDPYRRPLEDE